MSTGPVQLAIETSSRHGSVAVGRGDLLLEAIPLTQQRHAVELLPAVNDLAGRHDFAPRDIDELYISIGPGSFTGLRIAVTVAKMLHRVTACRLVAVPTLDVVVRNVPDDHEFAAVCLNAKRGACYTGIYRRNADDWHRLTNPAVWTPDQLLDEADQPLAIIGDKLPDYDWPGEVTILEGEPAVPRAQVVWQLGRDLAAQTQFTDAYQMSPLYIRLPEAEEVWRQKNETSLK